MDGFRADLEQGLLQWRQNQGSAVCQEPYHWVWRGKSVSTDLAFPKEHWTDNYWPRIREDVAARLAGGVLGHDWNNHLASSWAACINLYLPFAKQPCDFAVLASFLREHDFAPGLSRLTHCEIEYAAPDDDPLHPRHLLGEQGGSRGKGQTSPDLALFGNLDDGRPVVVLTESKLTETSFYDCSAFRGKPEEVKARNLTACASAAAVHEQPDTRCWLRAVHGRRYWHIFKNKLAVEALAANRACPAKASAYQLFRQQALAEGYADSGRFGLVVSAVAYDDRNTQLLDSLAAAGISDLPAGWARLFTGKARFASWTHQEWVGWVRSHSDNARWDEWLEYVGARYGY